MLTHKKSYTVLVNGLATAVTMRVAPVLSSLPAADTTSETGCSHNLVMLIGLISVPLLPAMEKSCGVGPTYLAKESAGKYTLISLGMSRSEI
jgi:hypothetical protein